MAIVAKIITRFIMATLIIAVKIEKASQTKPYL